MKDVQSDNGGLTDTDREMIEAWRYMRDAQEILGSVVKWRAKLQAEATRPGAGASPQRDAKIKSLGQLAERLAGMVGRATISYAYAGLPLAERPSVEKVWPADDTTYDVKLPHAGVVRAFPKFSGLDVQLDSGEFKTVTSNVESSHALFKLLGGLCFPELRRSGKGNRIYIAGSSQPKQRKVIAGLMSAVEVLGYKVTFDWVGLGRWDETELTDEDLAAQARFDLDAVLSADVVWYVVPEAEAGKSEGSATELGMALVLARLFDQVVISSGELDQVRIFPRLAQHFDGHGAALRFLEQRLASVSAPVAEEAV